MRRKIMKIDNYAMDMQSHTYESRSTNTTFKDILLVENTQEVEDLPEMDSIEEEVAFMQRLQFDLLNKLLTILNMHKVQHTCGCEHETPKAELKVFEQNNAMNRKLSFETTTTRSQTLDVSMQGWVQSGDKKIDINMDLLFSNSFVESISVDETVFHDPLVINYDTDIPELGSLDFKFDIDMDGEEDQISTLKKGSGFIALDKNENGKIDDGYELFGTQNGNGFIDLARYDDDGNKWIDENDEIFDKLRIWSKNEDEDVLFGLGEKGVGAIYLGHAEGEFDMVKDGEVGAKIRSNGLFLNEDGTSGFMTQIDFAKQQNNVEEKASPLGDLLKVV